MKTARPCRPGPASKIGAALPALIALWLAGSIPALAQAPLPLTGSIGPVARLNSLGEAAAYIAPTTPAWENHEEMEADQAEAALRFSSTDDDAAHYARGLTMVVHVFINHTGHTWSSSERETAAARALVAKDYYVQNAPAGANVHFDNEDGASYYYYTPTLPRAIPADGMTNAFMEEALDIIGFDDDDADGILIDDASLGLQGSLGGWDNVIFVFEPADISGRAFASMSYSRCCLYTDDVGNVYAHEWGHLFGACDEYVEDGHCHSGLDCGPCSSTYLDEVIDNGNCQLEICPSDVNCLMIYNSLANICNYTLNHWGWVDEDSNGTLDYVKRRTTGDTFVRINEIPHESNVLSGNTTDGWVMAQKHTGWCAAGLRSPAGADYDLRMYGDNNHNHLVASSLSDGEAVDFVVGDYNHNQLQNEHLQVNSVSGTGNYRLQWEGGPQTICSDGSVRTESWEADWVVRTYDLPLFGGETVAINMAVTSGSPDLGLALFKSNGSYYYAGRASAQWVEDSGGAGDSESHTYTVPSDDVYGLVIFGNNHVDGQFSLQIGPTLATLAEETPYYSAYPLRLYRYNPNAYSWSFLGCRPDPDADVTLRLFDDDHFMNELAGSDIYTGVEFVAADYSEGYDWDYPRVARTAGAGNHRTEWEQDDDLLPGVASVSWTSTHVGKVWDTYMVEGQSYFFREYHGGTSLDTGLYLFSSHDHDNFKPRASYSAASNSHEAADGGEWFGFTAPADDWYGFYTIMNNEASGTFSLWCGPSYGLSSGSHVTSSSEVVWGRAPVSATDWAAYGVRPSPGDQASVWLYGDEAYTISTLHAADQSGLGVNFVVADFNHAPTGTYYPRWRRTAGTGAIDCGWEGGVGGLIFQPNQTTSTLHTWMAGDVVEANDLLVDGSIPGGQHVTVRVEDMSGRMNLGVAVFRSPGAEYYGDQADAMALADDEGVGGTETVSFVATQDDAYGLIVFNQSDEGGSFRIVLEDPTSAAPEAGSPLLLDLRASSSNPFARQAGLSLSLPRAQEIDLAVYDIGGRRLRELLAGRCPNGVHSVLWDGRDDEGRDLPSGVYLARLRTADRELKVKLVRCL